jgi:hypothetical protein
MGCVPSFAPGSQPVIASAAVENGLRILLRMVAAGLLLAATTGRAHAQNDDESRARAKAAFEHGVAEYAAGQYEQALGHFQEAYRARPHPLVNVNIANCYDKLGKPLPAIALFEHFLESDAGSPAQRQEVTTALERLKRQVGKILLRVSPDGAAVMIDQGEQRTAPILEAIPLEAGNHLLTVQLEGYRTLQRALIVKGGTTLELSAVLEREGAAVPAIVPGPAPMPNAAEPPPIIPPTQEVMERAPSAATAETPAEDKAPGAPTAAFITGGVALALLATGTVTGVLALGANKDFTQYKSQYKAAPSDPTSTPIQRVSAYNHANDAADRARSLALTTDIALAGAGVAAAVTIYLLASHGTSSSGAEHAQLAPIVTRNGAGVLLQTKISLLE